MRAFGPILVALLIIGAVVTLGVTGVLNLIYTGWTTIIGGAQ